MENEKDDPPPADYEGAVAHLEWTLRRVRRERAAQEEYRLTLIEDLRICELLLGEAVVAEEALEALLGGRVYDRGRAVLRRWDGYEAHAHIDVRASPSALEYQGVPPEPPPASPRPKPSPAMSVVTPPSSPVKAEEPPKAELAPPALATATARRPCAPPAPPLPKPDLTDKQKALFDCICNSAGTNWTVTISHGRLRQITGLSLGSMSAHLYALEKKDMIRVVDHGNAKNAGTYVICEAVRPARPDPKMAEERRIAEMFARAH